MEDGDIAGIVIPIVFMICFAYCYYKYCRCKSKKSEDRIVHVVATREVPAEPQVIVIQEPMETGGILGIIIPILISLCALYSCYKCCCKSSNSGSDDVPMQVVATREVVVPVQPQVLVYREQQHIVQDEDGIRAYHTRTVADSDGNLAARQSIYAIS